MHSDPFKFRLNAAKTDGCVRIQKVAQESSKGSTQLITKSSIQLLLSVISRWNIPINCNPAAKHSTSDLIMKCFCTLIVALAIAACSRATQPPKSPELNWLLSAKVTPGEPIVIGPVPGGTRTALPIAGGTFWGPVFNGTFVPVGVDAGIVTPDGKFYPGGVAVLRTDDGANIIFRDDGFQTGDTIYGAVTFETGAERYEWLNRVVLVSAASFEGQNTSGGVTLNIFVVRVFLFRN
jgi:hypothetical protein